MDKEMVQEENRQMTPKEMNAFCEEDIKRKISDGEIKIDFISLKIIIPTKSPISVSYRGISGVMRIAEHFSKHDIIILHMNNVISYNLKEMLTRKGVIVIDYVIVNANTKKIHPYLVIQQGQGLTQWILSKWASLKKNNVQIYDTLKNKYQILEE